MASSKRYFLAFGGLIAQPQGVQGGKSERFCPQLALRISEDLVKSMACHILRAARMNQDLRTL